jgi:hypothetical protein
MLAGAINAVSSPINTAVNLQGVDSIEKSDVFVVCNRNPKQKKGEK